MKPFKRVIIESPYAGEVEKNTEYLYACLRESIGYGEYPLASHAIYPKVLDDNNPQERALGISLGYGWWDQSIPIIFYVDRGWSLGMIAAAKLAAANNHLRIIRRLGVAQDLLVSPKSQPWVQGAVQAEPTPE